MNQLFPNDKIHLKLHCPNCREILHAEAKRCKYCGEEIDGERVKFNTLNHSRLTSAIIAADSLKAENSAIIIYLASTSLSLWLKWMLLQDEFFIIWVVLEGFNFLYVFVSFKIIEWFINHGSLEIIDNDYKQKKTELRRLLAKWTAAYVFHYVLIFGIG